ncbi:outer membrane protein transport protein [soil metagenome]
MSRRARGAALVAALMTLCGGSMGVPAARAQAYLRWDQSARPVALGGAAAALAEDPSAVFYNPAGIVHLPGTHLQAGGTLAVDEARFRAFGGSAFARDEAPVFDGALYATHTVAERLTGGLGINAPWGLSVEWQDPDVFVGRFRSVESRLGTVQFNPVLAYGPVGSWSAALGVDVLDATFDLARFEQDPALSALGGTAPIALAETVLDMGGTAFGWNTALMYRPSERFTAGAQFRSEIEIDLSGRTDFTVVAPADLRVIVLPGRETTVGALLDARYVDQVARSMLTFPALGVAGISYRPVAELLIVVDAQWVGWEAVESIALAFADTALAELLPLDYEDAWAVRWGAELEYRPGLFLRLGYAWQESPAPSPAVTPLLPDAGRDTYSAGFGFDWEGTAVDLAYRVSVLDDREGVAFPENTRPADGIYEGVSHRIGVSLSRPF